MDKNFCSVIFSDCLQTSKYWENHVFQTFEESLFSLKSLETGDTVFTYRVTRSVFGNTKPFFLCMALGSTKSSGLMFTIY